jgi:hypothetical protein
MQTERCARELRAEINSAAVIGNAMKMSVALHANSGDARRSLSGLLSRRRRRRFGRQSEAPAAPQCQPTASGRQQRNTVLANETWQKPAGSRTLFQQPILTRVGIQRVALLVPVKDLASRLREIEVPCVELEHIYDY